MERLARAAAAGALTADLYPYLAPIYTVNLSLAQAARRHAPQNIIIKAARDPQLAGRSLAALAAEAGVEAGQLARTIAREDPGVVAVAEEMREEHLVGFLRQGWVAVSNDASARPIYSADRDITALHPRTWGTFGRLFRRYVGDLQVMSLEQAIHRVTGLPAAIAGLGGRGIIRPGCRGDLVVMDPGQVSDRACWHQPQQLPTGILHVAVNGRLVVTAGQLDGGVRAGRVVRLGESC